LIELARDIAMFRPVMEQFVRGKPDALLLVEFAEDAQDENLARLDRLEELMGDLGHPGAVIKVSDPAQQASIWGVRAAGLNIMMSMKSDGKPVSFIEDCAVPLEHLADYTERLTEVFTRHGTTGTWYAHASVGCLHVRPVLNLKLEHDVKTMRAIAEDAFAMVREYKGSHSGEHGDGLVRSEFHEAMYGRRTVEIFEEIKDRFDPDGVLNPGKIVRPSKMDDRSLFRYRPDYAVKPFQTRLDWSAYTGQGGGFQGAVEMCNNNGECRKMAGGAMCPSYRVTRNERDLTRGRANTLRLAISGQLDEQGLGSDAMLEAMKLCVSCKACRRECPTGVDMAKMKIEVMAAANARRGLSVRDRLVAYLPRYAPYARWLSPLLNLRDQVPGLAKLSEPLTGFSASRTLPKWRFDAFNQRNTILPPGMTLEDGAVLDEEPRVLALFVDTFNRYFEPENAIAAIEVLTRLGYGIDIVGAEQSRPVCCGRTFLAAGMVDEAKAEARRFLDAIREPLELGMPIVGLEPSCLLSLRDEFGSLVDGELADEIARQCTLLEEFLATEARNGRIKGPIGHSSRTVHLHGHCHQKSYGAMDAVTETLGLVQGLTVKQIESSCCGMAGSFGYQSETIGVSKQMAELSLLPAVRAASPNDLIAADGFSCRHQISDGSGREALHVARILRDAMAGRG
ncbi:MAG: 4Fe-4S dicluster domain-containing protein, partial [Hyphomicrobiaceae bacterium]|nr:4Fe-4S dicluster domain-containing protein [Hyphomicrobiaceae bacterium]